MTWRRFTALLNGLSVGSWWMRLIASSSKDKGPRVITDPAEGQRYFDSIR